MVALYGKVEGGQRRRMQIVSSFEILGILMRGRLLTKPKKRQKTDSLEIETMFRSTNRPAGKTSLPVVPEEAPVGARKSESQSPESNSRAVAPALSLVSPREALVESSGPDA